MADKFLRTYCYATNYVFTLLTDGYKFDEETWKNINFKREVGCTKTNKINHTNKTLTFAHAAAFCAC